MLKIHANKEQLNEDLLSDYMDSFLGYGNIQGSYWFVGMEEGGGKTCPEIAQRITQWENRANNRWRIYSNIILALTNLDGLEETQDYSQPGTG